MAVNLESELAYARKKLQAIAVENRELRGLLEEVHENIHAVEADGGASVALGPGLNDRIRQALGREEEE